MARWGWWLAAVLLGGPAGRMVGQTVTVPGLLTERPTAVLYGPYNGRFLAGGVGLEKALHAQEPLASAQAGWSLTAWVKPAEAGETALLAGVGREDEATPRYLLLRAGRPVFWAGGGDWQTGGAHEVAGPAALGADAWHAVAVSVDAAGVAHLLVDGAEVASGMVPLGPAAEVLQMAPVRLRPGLGSMAEVRHFGGLLAQVSLRAVPVGAAEMREMAAVPAGLDLLPFEEGSKAWPVQSRAGANGYKAPQDPALLPHSRAKAQAAVASAPLSGTDAVMRGGTEFAGGMERVLLRHGWQMVDAAVVAGGGAEVSRAGFAVKAADAGQMNGWMAATVPGTALVTLIDRGVYPNPDFGLNNLAIPESLKEKSWWYRNEVEVPASMRGRRLTLRLHGVNYHAAVWVNGTTVGEVTGAFLHRGFDVTPYVKAGERAVVAVKVDGPPHPGIAHEQSLLAGAGDNGGVMMLDGPTFGATEGWDWIPGIRDRNTGLWQDVALEARGALEMGAPQIVTMLGRTASGEMDRGQATVTVRVPVRNGGGKAVRGTVTAGFDGVTVTKAVTVAAGGEAMVEMLLAEFKQLRVEQPKLWWPNGYGAPALHTMTLTAKVGGGVSDAREERFGIRELSYEVTALDGAGHTRRVEVRPAEAFSHRRAMPVLQTHEGFRETAEGWVTTLATAGPGAAVDSLPPGVRESSDRRAEPDLVVRVNGERIAVRGGAWGMDDMLKRVGRARMEPYFRLHQEANVNTIRNWMGQDTEDVFFELADEYGMLVWSDFWDSTQDWNLEPTDAGLFLENAKEVIERYRNHPSVMVWCGRNEGVPQPTINDGLAKLVAEEDGTRYYSADSNKINLHDSGPYKYQEPEDYFTKLSLGFAVEVGLASPPTREVWQASLAPEDQWPISDAWAYHDWHQGGNGDTGPFMEAMNEEFGAPVSLADFDRKAQMLNYEAHRAVFEGMNAHLWAPNSGRLLWMTQPAWPSSVWQVFSHDYDTQGSFYGVKKANEPVHVQMNLPGYEVAVVNNTEEARAGLTATARVVGLDGAVLLERRAVVTAPATAVTTAMPLELLPLLEKGPVLVRLELRDGAGALVSENVYWEARRKADLRAMDAMAPAQMTVTTAVGVTRRAGERVVAVTLRNGGTVPAVATKLTLVEAATGLRVLPAYPSDNYVSLLPGESKVVEIAYPEARATGAVRVGVRGWNVPETTVEVGR